MGRLLAIAAGLASVVLAFFVVITRAEPETRFYVQIAALMVVVIIVAVLVTSLIAWIGLKVFDATFSGTIGNRFSLFVGWTLLKSHRTRRSAGTVLREERMKLVSGKLWRRAVSVGVGLLLLVFAWWMTDRATFNVFAEWTSPLVARMLQITAIVLGGLRVLYGLPTLVLRRRPRPVKTVMLAANRLTLQPFVSIVGVSLGVWSLIVVLSVMHGFADDLRSKILRTNAHIVIEPAKGEQFLGDALTLEEKVRGVPDVVEAHAMTTGEVMMSSSTNVVVNVVVKGLRDEALATAQQLEGAVSPGSVAYLTRPEALLSDRFRFPISGYDEPATPDTPEPAPPKGDDEAVPGDLPPPDGAPEPPPKPAPDAAPNPAADLGLEWPGSPFGPGSDVRVLPGVLLGVELARSLNLQVGSEVQIISPDGDIGPTGLRPKLKSFRVAGIFTTGMYEYDQKLAYMAIDDAQRFFNLGSEMNRLEIRVSDAEKSLETLDALQAVIGGWPQKLRAMGWRERNRNLFSALELERVAMFIILGLTMLVAALSIVSSLVMIVVQRQRDVAVLKALGASNRDIVKTFLTIGGFIGVLATLTGTAMGVGFAVGLDVIGIPMPSQYYIQSLPVALDAGEVAVVALSAFGMCLLATVYPSLIASRLQPVEGLRHG